MRQALHRGILTALAVGVAMALTTTAASARERHVDIIGGIDRFFQDLGNAFSGGRGTVSISPKYAPNSIIVSTRERVLYFVTQRGQALRYPVGVGREGYQWGGVSHVSRKAKWPGWTPPAAMRKRQPYLPKYMPGGPGNPLGARALYIGSSLYRIHGTSEAHTIGRAVSSGCIRMLNEDVIDLYQRVPIGAKVYVHQ